MITQMGQDNSRSSQLDFVGTALLRPLGQVVRTPLGSVGLVLVGAWIIVAATAPWIAPFNPISQNGPLLQAPSAMHLLGTDELGRDVFSRMLWGARLSLPLAALLVAGTVAIGGTLGAIAGYFRGVSETIIMRLTDLVFAFPTILLAMTVTAALGPSLRNAVVALMAVSWPSYARLVRALVASLGGADYMNATRLLGASARRALVIDVLPNIAGPVLALATLHMGTGVLLLAALSFLGLGAQPPAAEWGSMIATGTQYFDKWWLGLFPGLAIYSVVLGYSLLGDSLRDAFDPKSSS